jgi:hypothetical protein
LKMKGRRATQVWRKEGKKEERRIKR